MEKWCKGCFKDCVAHLALASNSSNLNSTARVLVGALLMKYLLTMQLYIQERLVENRLESKIKIKAI